MGNQVDRDGIIWDNLPRTAAIEWWRFVAGAGGLPVGALNLRGLPGFDLGSFGLLVPLGLLDLGLLDLRALEALYLRCLGGSLVGTVLASSCIGRGFRGIERALEENVSAGNFATSSSAWSLTTLLGVRLAFTVSCRCWASTFRK